MATKKTGKKAAGKKVTKKKATTKSDSPTRRGRSSKKPASPSKVQGKGRPKGSATAAAVIVDVIKSRCPHCNSSSVAWSGAPIVRIAHGISPLTQTLYQAVRFTRKRCECGQTRVEKEYLDRVPG